MTGKHILWSVIMLGVFVASVHFGNIAIDKGSERGDEIFDIRDKVPSLEAKIRDYDFKVKRLTGKLDWETKQVTKLHAVIQGYHERRSYEAYVRYREEDQFATQGRDYQFYLKLNDICIWRETNSLEETLARKDRIESELSEAITRKESEQPKAERELKAYLQQYASELNPDNDPYKNIYYYPQAVCTILMTLSFCILMKICPPFRATAYFILGAAAVNYLVNRDKE